MIRRRGILSAAVVAVALVLSACAGLPTSGPVNEGNDADAEVAPPDFSFLPDHPQPGATPEEIVEGFIRAGSGPGITGDWERAREFLAPDIRSAWKPTAGVTIDLSSDRVYSSTAEDSVSLSLVAVANVDANGGYERTDEGPRSLPFKLALQEDGEWRITETIDGIVLDRDVFPRVFNDYSVMYFDRTWEYLVPDVRWFPTANAASRVTDALVNKPPSDWLKDSVVTAFPQSVSASPSVPIESGGVAEVDLSDSALAAPPATLDRMLTQLQASLSTAGATDVVLTVSGAPIAAEPVAVRSTRVTGPSLVLTEAGFGFLVGDEVEPVPGLTEVMRTVSPVAIQVTAERDWAALRLTDGTVARQGADGSSALLDTRPELIDPTIDPFNVVWSVPRSQPTALSAFLLDGTQVAVADAWPEATQITAMAVSRDGTRLAALVTSGARSAVWVAGVVRGPDDIVPVRLGAPVPIGALAGAGIGLAWLDDKTVGVLSHEGEESVVLEQLVGGPTATTTGPTPFASIAGGGATAPIRLRSEDGALYVRRGTNGQQSAEGILVLATQQGTPQG
jgi:hypothetical protein